MRVQAVQLLPRLSMRYHELGQMMSGRGPGSRSHVSDARVCGYGMGASQGTADHMLGRRERREGCSAGLRDPLWRHDDNWVTK